MANAEKLLHEAQYAFNSISFGDTRENRRHSAKASALAKKILRKYPGTTEAYVARSLLRRLGEEAYAKRFDHSHAPPAETTVSELASGTAESDVRLNWSRLISGILALPKAVLLPVAAGFVLLYALFGPLLLLLFVAFVLITGPMKHILPPTKRQQLDELIVSINSRFQSD